MQTPSFYFDLLKERVGEVAPYKTAISDEEFNILFAEDPSFRETVRKELKDILGIVENLLKQGN